ncbi:neuroglian-like [Littorina saxatilis]|uniref:Ig-like domain-containing protein n=1 Tax=Littorina saxatilis TaxID=31220 RepID=A0AAN9AR10_9CAEN
MAGGTRLASILLLSVFLFVRAQDDIREPPKILEPASADELFYDGGVDVTLQCRASGQPTPLYEWYWNGAPIESTNQAITYDPSTGLLTIKGLTTREEGFYNCRARNTFPNGMSAVAISHKIEVRRARIEPWTKDEDRTKTATEGNYVSITCGDNLPKYYGTTTFKWYTVEGDDDLIEVEEDKRVFIDNKGTLHFTYVLRTDEQSNRFYSCAMSNVVEGQITLGGRTRLVVQKSDSIAEVKPALQFSTKLAGDGALTFKRNTIGHLECFFSGYVNDPGNEVPSIKWLDNAGNEIVSGTDSYTIESNGRVLKIASLEEADEKPYTCIGRNTIGTAEGRMTLNVTSSPIWVKPLQSTTVPQGKHAVFHCEARSAAGEVPPDPPRWFKNGQRLDMTYDPNKFAFSNEKRELRVKSAQKNTDIACFQCYVGNSVGEEFSDGCLNVILPIEFVAKPVPEQTIERGDIVNLTVVATADKLYPISYKWHFNNKTYEGVSAPPHVIYDVITNLAYINTSDLTDEQMRDIRGVYRRQVYHEFETVFVNVEVKLKDEPVVVPVAAAGFDYWIIGLIIGILLIIIIILIICCVICRRKMLEGEYPVDRKETAAGLDPEKELKDSGFHDLSRADYDYYPEKKSPALDFDDIPIGEGDDESFGSAEYGEEATAFNEDGSFIGVYSKGKKAAPPAYQPPKSESDV